MARVFVDPSQRKRAKEILNAQMKEQPQQGRLALQAAPHEDTAQ